MQIGLYRGSSLTLKPVPLVGTVVRLYSASISFSVLLGKQWTTLEERLQSQICMLSQMMDYPVIKIIFEKA